VAGLHLRGQPLPYWPQAARTELLGRKGGRDPLDQPIDWNRLRVVELEVVCFGLDPVYACLLQMLPQDRDLAPLEPEILTRNHVTSEPLVISQPPLWPAQGRVTALKHVTEVSQEFRRQHRHRRRRPSSRHSLAR